MCSIVHILPRDSSWHPSSFFSLQFWCFPCDLPLFTHSGLLSGLWTLLLLCPWNQLPSHLMWPSFSPSHTWVHMSVAWGQGVCPDHLCPWYVEKYLAHCGHTPSLCWQDLLTGPFHLSSLSLEHSLAWPLQAPSFLSGPVSSCSQSGHPVLSVADYELSLCVSLFNTSFPL